MTKRIVGNLLLGLFVIVVVPNIVLACDPGELGVDPVCVCVSSGCNSCPPLPGGADPIGARPDPLEW